MSTQSTSKYFRICVQMQGAPSDYSNGRLDSANLPFSGMEVALGGIFGSLPKKSVYPLPGMTDSQGTKTVALAADCDWPGGIISVWKAGRLQDFSLADVQLQEQFGNAIELDPAGALPWASAALVAGRGREALLSGDSVAYPRDAKAFPVFKTLSVDGFPNWDVNTGKTTFVSCSPFAENTEFIPAYPGSIGGLKGLGIQTFAAGRFFLGSQATNIPVAAQVIVKRWILTGQITFPIGSFLTIPITWGTPQTENLPAMVRIGDLPATSASISSCVIAGPGFQVEDQNMSVWMNPLDINTSANTGASSNYYRTLDGTIGAANLNVNLQISDSPANNNSPFSVLA